MVEYPSCAEAEMVLGGKLLTWEHREAQGLLPARWEARVDHTTVWVRDRRTVGQRTNDAIAAYWRKKLGRQIPAMD